MVPGFREKRITLADLYDGERITRSAMKLLTATNRRSSLISSSDIVPKAKKKKLISSSATNAKTPSKSQRPNKNALKTKKSSENKSTAKVPTKPQAKDIIAPKPKPKASTRLSKPKPIQGSTSLKKSRSETGSQQSRSREITTAAVEATNVSAPTSKSKSQSQLSCNRQALTVVKVRAAVKKEAQRNVPKSCAIPKSEQEEPEITSFAQSSASTTTSSDASLELEDTKGNRFLVKGRNPNEHGDDSDGSYSRRRTLLRNTGPPNPILNEENENVYIKVEPGSDESAACSPALNPVPAPSSVNSLNTPVLSNESPLQLQPLRVDLPLYSRCESEAVSGPTICSEDLPVCEFGHRCVRTTCHIAIARHPNNEGFPAPSPIAFLTCEYGHLCNRPPPSIMNNFNLALQNQAHVPEQQLALQTPSNFHDSTSPDCSESSGSHPLSSDSDFEEAEEQLNTRNFSRSSLRRYSKNLHQFEIKPERYSALVRLTIQIVELGKLPFDAPISFSSFAQEINKLATSSNIPPFPSPEFKHGLESMQRDGRVYIEGDFVKITKT